DEETRRVALDKPHDVADDIGPQPGATRQDRRVIDAGLDVTDPVPCRLRRADLLDRDEFVENAVVEIDPHTLTLAPVRAGDKTFARGIDLARLGAAAVEPFGKAGAVRREINTAMNDHFQIRKEISEPRAAFGI